MAVYTSGRSHTVERMRKRQAHITSEGVYVESSKLVPMNLFAGQEERCRLREWTCGHRAGEEKEEQLGKVIPRL